MASDTAELVPSIIPAVLAALFYAISSVLIMFLNKVVLTSYGLPSSNILAASQYIATMLICLALRGFSLVDFPSFSIQTFRDIHPLPLVYVGNTLSGLVGTKRVNLPMFTTLRRVSILMTMSLEGFLLNVEASNKIQFSVFLMLFGSFIAALHDLSFDLFGYAFIFLNDIFTAAQGVITKQKTDAKKLGEWGVMFYNTLISFPLVAAIVFLDYNSLLKCFAFPHWSSPPFLLCFFASSVMGCVMQYSSIHCTNVNSALTTTVVGCLKNVLTAYIGMLMVDYRFTWLNFVGLNISILGSVYYSFVRLRETSERKRAFHASSNETPILIKTETNSENDMKAPT